MALRLWTHEEVLASQQLPRPCRLVPGVLLSPQAVTVARTPTSLPVPTHRHVHAGTASPAMHGVTGCACAPWPPCSAHSSRRRRGAQNPSGLAVATARLQPLAHAVCPGLASCGRDAEVFWGPGLPGVCACAGHVQFQGSRVDGWTRREHGESPQRHRRHNHNDGVQKRFRFPWESGSVRDEE